MATVRLFFFLSFVLLGAACTSSSPISKEENAAAKRRLDDFITYVNKGDFSEAEKFWTGESKRILEGSDHTIPFPAFCERFMNLGEYRVSDVFMEKKVPCLIIFWEAEGESRQWPFGLRKIDDEWYFIRGYNW